MILKIQLAELKGQILAFSNSWCPYSTCVELVHILRESLITDGAA